MGSFEDRVHGSDISEAEFALQWSSEDGLFSLGSFARVVEAAKYFRGQTADRDALREKVAGDENVLAGAVARIDQLEDSLAETQDENTELVAENLAMKKVIKALDKHIQAIKETGDNLLDEVEGLTVDGWAAPWENAAEELRELLDAANDDAIDAHNEFLDAEEDPEEKSADESSEADQSQEGEQAENVPIAIPTPAL